MGVLLFLFLIIIGLLYLQNKRLEQFKENKDVKTDVEQKYIENGSFEEGKGIPNSIGAINGNEFILFKNPGNSGYVLRMGVINKKENPKGMNGYLFKVKLPPGKTYRISAFEHISLDYKGSREVFRVRQYLTNGKNRLFMSEGNIISTQTIGENTWNLKDYVFTLEPNGTETLDIIIGHNTNILDGYKYYTDIQIDDFSETLTTFPITNGLLLYLNAMNIRENTKELLDYSGNNRNFKSYQGKILKYTRLYGINIYKGRLIGPASNSIGLQSNEFSIGWYMTVATRKKTSFFRIYANDTVQHGFEIYYMPEKGTGKNKLFIHYRNSEYEINIGVIKSLTPLVLTYKKGFFTLYVNGNKIWSQRYKKSRRENKLNIETNIFTITKPIQINDSGQLIGGFMSLVLYNRELNKMEVRKISDYYHLQYAKVRNNDVFKTVLNNEMNNQTNLNKYCGPYSKDNPIVKELKVVDLDLCPKWNPNPDPKQWVKRDKIRCWGCNY